MIARAGQRGVALTVMGAVAVAIAGIAIAGGLTSSNNTASTQAASTTSPSATPNATPSATKSSGPLGPTLPGQHSSQPSPQVTHTAAPSPTSPPSPLPTPSANAKPTPTPSASAKPTSSCPNADGRVAAARKLLQHQSALPGDVLLQVEGPRQGLLGASDAQARTVTLYVRNCSQEPTLQLAVVWGYEAGQFIFTERWDSKTRSQWNQLRGSNFSTSAQFKQDAASVYAFWQTGSTQYWQSPISPPSFSQLSKLVPYLKTS